MCAVSALRTEFLVSLGYVVRPCLKVTSDRSAQNPPGVDWLLRPSLMFLVACLPAYNTG